MLIHLHIGIDKAGSTAIQSNLKRNRDWFHHRALFIPNTGLVSTGYREVFDELPIDVFERVYRELDLAAAMGFEHAFMSWEGISFYSDRQVRKLRDRLGDHEVKIYVYLREQAEIVQSGYFQQVKTNEHRTFLSEYHKETALFFPDNRDYAVMLKRFAKVFGEHAINVRVFQRELLKGNNVVIDMLDMLGLEPDDDLSLRSGEDNPSLDTASVKIMHLLDAQFTNNSWGGKKISQRGVSSEQKYSGPLQQQAEAILTLYYGESPQGREDVIDILLNIIDIEGKVGKYFLTEAECERIRLFYSQSNREVVARFFHESWPYCDLFTYSRLPVADASVEAIASVVPLRLEAIMSTQGYRTWDGRPLEGKHVASIIDEADGWCGLSELGVQCDGAKSTLRFRVAWKHINSMHTWIALVTEVQASKQYLNSTVLVNDQNLGDYDLRRVRIEIPLTLLRPLGLVDIVMQHHFTSFDAPANIKPASGEPGFTLKLIKYMLRQ